MNPNITPEFILGITAILLQLIYSFYLIKENHKKDKRIDQYSHHIKLFQREFKLISCFILEKNLTSELWSYVEKNNQELKNNDEIIIN